MGYVIIHVCVRYGSSVLIFLSCTNAEWMQIHRSQKVLIPEAPNYLHKNRNASCCNFAL